MADDWRETHSVTCASCGTLVDERGTARSLFDGNIEFGAGELCRGCAARLEASNGMLAALEYAAETIKVARQHFPKSIKHTDRFRLELTAATIGTALAKAKEGA